MRVVVINKNAGKDIVIILNHNRQELLVVAYMKRTRRALYMNIKDVEVRLNAVLILYRTAFLPIHIQKVMLQS